MTDSSAEPICILVLGMHRSGTSAFAGMLGILGCTLPKTLIPSSPSNPKGHFEPKDVVEIHDRILASLDSSWVDFRRIDPIKFTAANIQPLKQALLTALKLNFGPSKRILVKDPRICRFLPFWRNVVDEFGAEMRLVIPLRNPIEVARSLAERDHLPLNHALNLWLRHVLDAEFDSRGTKRIFVPYSDLLRDWRLVVDRIERGVGLKFRLPTATIDAAIESLLEHDLRHHRVDELELNREGAEHPWILATYQALNELVKRDYNPATLITLDRIREQFDQAAKAFGTGNIVLSRAEELEGECGRLYREMLALIGQIEDRDRRLEESQQQLTKADRDLRELLGQVAKCEGKLAVADRDLRRLMEELTEREGRLVGADSDLRRLTVEVAQGETKLAAADGDLRRLMGELAEREGRLAAADGDLRRLLGEVADSEARLAAADRDLRRLTVEVAERETKLAAADGDLRRLTGELAEREGRLAAADGDLRRLLGEVADREARLVAADRDLRRLMAEVTERDSKLVAADQALRHLVGEVAARENRLTMVEQRLHGVQPPIIIASDK